MSTAALEAPLSTSVYTDAEKASVTPASNQVEPLAGAKPFPLTICKQSKVLGVYHNIDDYLKWARANKWCPDLVSSPSDELKWKIAEGIAKLATPTGSGCKITFTALFEEARKASFTGKIGQTEYYTSRGWTEEETKKMKADRASGAGGTSRALLGPEGVKAQLRAINPNYKDHPNYAETQAHKAALWTEEKRKAQSDEMKAIWVAGTCAA